MATTENEPQTPTPLVTSGGSSLSTLGGSSVRVAKFNLELQIGAGGGEARSAVEQVSGPSPGDAEGIDSGPAPGPAATPIEELFLSVRAYNLLRRAGFRNVGELTARSSAELAAISGMGQKTL